MVNAKEDSLESVCGFYCCCCLVDSHELGLRELTALGDLDLGAGRAAGRADALDGLENVQARDHAAEDHVAAVQPRGLDRADEELATIRVGARVGHAENASARVATASNIIKSVSASLSQAASRANYVQLEVLVVKLGSVDAFAAHAVEIREVSLQRDTIRTK